MSSDFWYGTLVGAISMTVFLSLVLKDEWAIWIVKRKNFPVWTQIILGIVLAYSVIYVALLIFEAVASKQYPSWPIYLLLFSGGFFIFKLIFKLSNKHLEV